MTKITNEDALEYHSKGRPGKLEVIPTKPYTTQRDLSLAYTPGVAIPCLEIEKNPDDAYKYTAKGNLVAVISNGTAVLGLGDIGALSGKPVMEGKGLLFKVFADVDVFDIEVNEKDPKKLIEVCKAISPTFGGINLEDIKAPECFEVEQTLIQALDIPVFHDDQHGTAIISGAGLLNALEITGKKIDKIKVVVCGAGAGAISCSKFYLSLGVKRENIVMCDSKGVLNKKRKDLNEFKKLFVTDRDVDTLAQALVGADMFLGLSAADQLTPEMLKTMAKEPIVFAMANPNPEIKYELAMAARNDLIFATGRSDYPNQINNVLGFPFIFRGALDVKASKINEQMKIAACHALARLAKEPVPERVNTAYNVKNLTFGKEYIIPKPLDHRLIVEVASAVAKAAMDSGVARKPITDWTAYHEELNRRLGYGHKIVRDITAKAKMDPKRVVFAEADNFTVLKAIQNVVHEGIAKPILLGNPEEINEMIKNNKLDLNHVEIIDPRSKEESKRRDKYAELYFERRQRKGVTLDESRDRMYNRDYFGIMMVRTGDADAFISGFTRKYADIARPALEIIGASNKQNHIAGMYVVITKKGPFFFADTTVNIQPSAQTLVDTTVLTAEEVRRFNLEPVIAMVSYSNFGETRDGSPERVQQAIEILHHDYPDLIVDGEMQANFAFNRTMRETKFPFSKINGKDVNTIIFPNLSSGNIAYKMMQEIGGAHVIGPILIGIARPIHILQMESSVDEIVDLTSIAVVDAQCEADSECL
jgi:malate dehydrogenase (oxaloacetate-decarboxylating)(NADP+)